MTADDYFAIQRLINLYFGYVDAAYFDAAGALFDEAEMIYTATGKQIIKDGPAVAELMRSFVQLHGEDGRPLTRHHSGNIIIEPDGDDAARASSSAIIFQATPEFPLQPIAEASYRDQFEKSDGSWSFARREMEMTLMGELRYHLTKPL